MDDGFFGGGSFGAVDDYYEYKSTSSGSFGGGGGMRPEHDPDDEDGEPGCGCVIKGFLLLFAANALLWMIESVLFG